MKGLLIRSPWIDLILDGRKTWEMRSTSTQIRGKIALIKAGSGQIHGTAVLTASLPALSLEQMHASVSLHGIPPEQIKGAFDRGWNTPWVLDDVEVFSDPRPYRHPSGAVTWVNLEDASDTAGPPAFAGAKKAESRAMIQARSVASRTGQTTVNPEAWVDVPLTAGNLRWNHVYLRGAAALLPVDCIGGPNRQSLGLPVTVTFQPGVTVDTDVAGDKMIFRARGAVGDFLERSGAREGDFVRISRTAERAFRVVLRPPDNG